MVRWNKRGERAGIAEITVSVKKLTPLTNPFCGAPDAVHVRILRTGICDDGRSVAVLAFAYDWLGKTLSKIVFAPRARGLDSGRILTVAGLPLNNLDSVEQLFPQYWPFPDEKRNIVVLVRKSEQEASKLLMGKQLYVLSAEVWKPRSQKQSCLPCCGRRDPPAQGPRVGPAMAVV